MILRGMNDEDFPEYSTSPTARSSSTKPPPGYKVPVLKRHLNALRMQWAFRAKLKPEEWNLKFGVYVDNALIGCKGA